ncbi:hypothetical protein [Lusitaniella coriacea]|nr:hypothetical protein [Lusitaniella coriacea]
MSTISMFLVVIVFVPNLTLFDFQYSLLGRNKKISPPAEKVLFEYHEDFCGFSQNGKGIVPSCTWKIYPEGLSISLFIYGETFVSIKDMIKLRSPDRDLYSQYTLSLRNRELRTHTIVLPNERIFTELENIVKRSNLGYFSEK